MTTLPPQSRSSLAAMFDRLADEHKFALQQCRECSTFQYPVREVCVNRLADELQWVETDSKGEILAKTVTHVSAEPYFQARVTITTGLVKLDCGPVAVCFLEAGMDAGTKVRLTIRRDEAGKGVLIAGAV